MGDHLADQNRTCMTRALELARRAEGFASPNPMVGCVIVKDGRVVGEGWHARAGAPHAEIEALRQAGAAARGADVYVTLEPCAHHGRTPPCAAALIEAGVARVFYASADPHAQARGGANVLRAAGVEVILGPHTDEALALNRFFFHAVETGRPCVVAKFAASLDGKIATRLGDSQWISSPASRARAHDLRQACDAIVVGANTVIADNPRLTARPDGRAPAHPIRFVLDSRLRADPRARVYASETPGRSLAVTTEAAPIERRRLFDAHGVETLVVPSDRNGRISLRAFIEGLNAFKALSVMVEGGGAVLGSFADERLIDEVWAFIAPRLIGGAGPSPVAGLGADLLSNAIELRDVAHERLGDDMLIRGGVSRGDSQRACADQRKEAACLPA